MTMIAMDLPSNPDILHRILEFLGPRSTCLTIGSTNHSLRQLSQSDSLWRIFWMRRCLFCDDECELQLWFQAACDHDDDLDGGALHNAALTFRHAIRSLNLQSKFAATDQPTYLLQESDGDDDTTTSSLYAGYIQTHSMMKLTNLRPVKLISNDGRQLGSQNYQLRQQVCTQTWPGQLSLLNERLFSFKKYHVRRVFLSIILATFTIMMGGLMSGQYIGRYLVKGDLKNVQNQVMNVASYSNSIVTDLFSIISFPLASATELSSSDDDDDDENAEGEVNQLDCEVAEPDGTCAHCLIPNADGSCHTWSNAQHYFNHRGEVEVKYRTCGIDYDEDNRDMLEVAEERSHYQKIFFDENLIVEDKCLWLDYTLQQCSSYRPHYHEPFVHSSAAYTDVTRVVIVGGGDSMLLHEVLKYPSLELVLALELDQVVTRNSFEHFKTQPHFDDERVQWWFGDGAKSLTLLPREYFGTFDLVLLDLSETVMSMTVTEGLDVFGAMKLLLSPTGIMAKNDFGYFDKLSRVFDTCIQLVIGDVIYICDYELVLCGTDQVDFLNPKFDHMKGVEGSTLNVDTLVYKPQEEGRDDHWGPLTDYSKYWGEPRDCLPPGTTKEVDDESIAYAGVLMIVEAENVSNMESILELEGPLKQLGYNIISSSSQPSEESGGMKHVVVLKEGYLLMESWPGAKYCKIDIHLWGGFDKQENIRSKILDMLGSKEGDWQSYRIVTGGVRGCHTRADDLKSTGPDLSKIGVCDEVREGSSKSVVLDTSSDDEAVMAPIIEAGLDEIIPTIVGEADGKNAVVICGPKGIPCRAKTNLENKGYESVTTLYSCPGEEDDVDTDLAMLSWREQMNPGGDFFPEEFILCGKGLQGKKAGVALRDITRFSTYPEVVVVDALAPSEHVSNIHEYFVRIWMKHIDGPFVFFVPILDATDEQRTSFLKSLYNRGDDEPEFYSEMYVGNGEKTMSFGLIHAGTSASFLSLKESLGKLNENDHVKFLDLRRVTIRGAARTQPKFNPVTFKQSDYDQQPGLQQFYSQRAIGLQSVFQLALKDAEEVLTASSIADAAHAATKSMSKGVVKESFHEIGEGVLYVALMSNAQVVVTWDGAGSVNVNIFTYDETVKHKKLFVSKFKAFLPSLNLVLKDKFPRGYGKVINKSNRVNRGESPSCYDHFKLCQDLSEHGRCTMDDAKDWMHANCQFSCGLCGKEKDGSRDEL